MSRPKRTAQDKDEQNAANKRLCSLPDVELKPQQFVDDYKTALSNADDLLDGYYNKYVSYLGSAAVSRHARETAVAVQTRVNKMQEILANSKRLFEEEAECLLVDVQAFNSASMDAICANSQWFLHGNILSIHRHELAEEFRFAQFAGQVNPDDLHACLHRSFGQEPQRLKSYGKHVFKKWFAQEHAEKLIWLTNELYILPGGEPLALDALMVYVTEVLRHTVLVCPAYDAVLQNLKQTLRTDHDAQHEIQAQLSTKRPFFELARLARQLRGLWKKFEDGQYEACEHMQGFWSKAECFHTGSFEMLNLLQRSAYGEVRSNVFLTVRTMLPAELTEEIAQYALVAEGLPVEPCEYVAKDLLDAYGEAGTCPVLQRLIWEKKNLPALLA